MNKNLFELFMSDVKSQFKDFGYKWTRYKELSCDWIIKKLPAGVGVDVGGTGYLVKKLQETGVHDVTYFDFFPPADPLIKKYVSADMTEFGNHFNEGSLDFITTRHTLEHSVAPLFQLWQFNKALKMDGLLIVVVPHHSSKWVWFYSHFNCLPHENWLMLFKRAGFDVVEVSAGTWRPKSPDFIEYRFVLKVKGRGIFLE